MRISGNLKELTRGFDGKQILSLSLNADFRETFDELKGSTISIDIRKAGKQRSLEANAYCWVLVDAIAEKTGIKKTEVYQNAIREVGGISSLHCIPNDQLDGFVEDWKSLGLGFQVETFPSKLPGCTNAVFYKGSHIFNTAQMSKLISLLIQEAEQQGIPTISAEETEKMLVRWGARRDSLVKQANENKKERQGMKHGN